MEEKDRKTAAIDTDPELPDTAAFEILDVLPEEEEENKYVQENEKQPKSGKNIGIIIAAAIILLCGIIWFIISR